MTIRNALVIGAGGDVGRATTDALTAAGARVLAASHERDATDPAQVAALSPRPTRTSSWSPRVPARGWRRSTNRAGSRSRPRGTSI
ncbi:hypothetical protein O1M54_43955 [Streptomyces diastatochromogenes]|nr:hypothetical protein [Streptomyces diastatochromogenes]